MIISISVFNKQFHITTILNVKTGSVVPRKLNKNLLHVLYNIKFILSQL